MNRDTINWILKKTEYRRSNMEHLPKKIHQNGISYTLVGEYYIQIGRASCRERV